MGTRTIPPPSSGMVCGVGSFNIPTSVASGPYSQVSSTYFAPQFNVPVSDVYTKNIKLVVRVHRDAYKVGVWIDKGAGTIVVSNEILAELAYIYNASQLILDGVSFIRLVVEVASQGMEETLLQRNLTHFANEFPESGLAK